MAGFLRYETDAARERMRIIAHNFGYTMYLARLYEGKPFMPTVAEHYGIAEYVGSDFSHPVLGHFYSWLNDPVGHFNHVHVATLPFGMPDGADRIPPPTGTIARPNLQIVIDAVAAKFPGRYLSLGTCVRKHRNSDSDQPWSQHTFCNAHDFAAIRSDQNDLIAWFNSEWREEDDVLTQDGNESLAFENGMKERAKGNPKPTKSPDMGDGKNYLAAAQAGWDYVNGTIPPVK